MKRILCLILAFTLCFMNGCSLASIDNNGTDPSDVLISPEESKAPDTEDVDVPEDEFLREYLKNIESQKPHVREAGEPTSYICIEENLVIGILYPETFYAPLDNAIELWVRETSEYYRSSVTSPLSEPAELTASYESRSIGGLVSVRISGTFLSEALAHPDDFTKTFCYDIPDGEMKDVSYLVLEEKLPLLTAMTAKKANIPEENADEGIFDNFFLTDEGIEIHLGRGKYLPASDGNVSVFFGYTDIADLLNEEFKRTVIPEDDPVFNEDTDHTTEPSETEPTTTEPPVTEPPVTEPPVTEPPVTEPPVTEPPVTEP
ncbi:MAG: hypothetical protein IKL24_00755, partial [Clostridia bacterium]|nr:hypothetical protein [Clostridia bacterium]